MLQEQGRKLLHVRLLAVDFLIALQNVPEDPEIYRLVLYLLPIYKSAPGSRPLADLGLEELPAPETRVADFPFMVSIQAPLVARTGEYPATLT